MNKMIRLAFAKKQKADAERIVIEAYKVFRQASENFEIISKHHETVRAEIVEMAGRN